MKILAIRLKNLTSIEGALEIDFTQEPLHSAGIFAISGPTGAGKSTILDALCLALYDRAPRFAASVETVYLTDVGTNQISQADVKNILRRGMSEGYAEVDFEGMTGHRYRSRWAVRRTRSMADGSLRTQTLQVTNLDTEEELQGGKRELLAQLVEAIGLTYEQFTRTVLLAQNDFATFLKSRESAKAELLEKLTGTEVYSRISQEVFSRNKTAVEAANLLKNSMDLIHLLPEEELQALLAEKEKQTEARAQGIKLLALLNEQFNTVRLLRTQEEQLGKKQQEEAAEGLKQEKLQEALAKQTEEQVRFRQQCEALQPELRRARELDVQIQSTKTRYEQGMKALQTTQQQTVTLEKKHQNESRALNAACVAVNLQVEQQVEQQALQQALQQAEQQLLQQEQQLARMQEKNDERVARLNAFGIQAVGEEQKKLLEERTALKRALEAVELLTQLRKRQEETTLSLQTLKQQLLATEAHTQSLKLLYENARTAMSKDVVTLRNNLKSEEPCPVCGSLSHPYNEGNEVADTLFHSIEKEYQEAADAAKKRNDQYIALQRDSSNLMEQQQAQEKQLTAYTATECEPTALNLRLTQLHRRLKELSEQLDAYQKLYAEWQQQENEIKTLRTRCHAWREGLTQVRLLLQQLAATDEQLTMARRTQAAEQERFNALSEELLRFQQERASLLKGKGADEAEAVVARREKELNLALEQARKEVESLQVRRSGLQGELKQLTVSITALRLKTQEIAEPERLPEILAAQQESNQLAERQLSATEALLLQQQQNKALLEVKQKEFAVKQEEAERWGKLNKLIGSADGAKFKIIAQSYTLNFLLLHANKHLSYLSRRYKLQQVPGTLALQVVDGDMCDEVRTVYSLSGGESFLISLALALGLSSLSSNSLKVESLFIDEGFGSLDADSLRMAMEALEQLQMQGRKIGVISHVQEMSERIAVQIQLHKSVNGRSKIEIG